MDKIRTFFSRLRKPEHESNKANTDINSLDQPDNHFILTYDTAVTVLQSNENIENGTKGTNKEVSTEQADILQSVENIEVSTKETNGLQSNGDTQGVTTKETDIHQMNSNTEVSTKTNAYGMQIAKILNKGETSTCKNINKLINGDKEEKDNQSVDGTASNLLKHNTTLIITKVNTKSESTDSQCINLNSCENKIEQIQDLNNMQTNEHIFPDLTKVLKITTSILSNYTNESITTKPDDNRFTNSNNTTEINEVNDQTTKCLKEFDKVLAEVQENGVDPETLSLEGIDDIILDEKLYFNDDFLNIDDVFDDGNFDRDSTYNFQVINNTTSKNDNKDLIVIEQAIKTRIHNEDILKSAIEDNIDIISISSDDSIVENNFMRFEAIKHGTVNTDVKNGIVTDKEVKNFGETKISNAKNTHIMVLNFRDDNTKKCISLNKMKRAIEAESSEVIDLDSINIDSEHNLITESLEESISTKEIKTEVTNSLNEAKELNEVEKTELTKTSAESKPSEDVKSTKINKNYKIRNENILKSAIEDNIDIISISSDDSIVENNFMRFEAIKHGTVNIDVKKVSVTDHEAKNFDETKISNAKNTHIMVLNIRDDNTKKCISLNKMKRAIESQSSEIIDLDSIDIDSEHNLTTESSAANDTKETKSTVQTKSTEDTNSPEEINPDATESLKKAKQLKEVEKTELTKTSVEGKTSKDVKSTKINENPYETKIFNIAMNTESSNETKSPEETAKVKIPESPKNNEASDETKNSSEFKTSQTKIDTISVSSDENLESISVKPNKELESDDCGYHSSDFEFISEEEAKRDGIIINFSLDREYFNSTERTEKVYSNAKNFKKMQRDPFGPGPSRDPGNNPHHRHEENVSCRENNVMPQEVQENQMMHMFRDMPAMPTSEIHYLENKSVHTRAPMLVQYEGVGFHLSLALHRHDSDEDDDSRDEARETKNKILELYPNHNLERNERKSRRRC